MNLSSKLHGDIKVITIEEPRLDAACAVDFKDAVRSHFADHSGPVLLDLSMVEFLDSSGLGSLVGVMKLLGGRKLEIAGAGEIVMKVFKLTRMDQVFVLHKTIDAALTSRSAA